MLSSSYQTLFWALSCLFFEDVISVGFTLLGCAHQWFDAQFSEFGRLAFCLYRSMASLERSYFLLFSCGNANLRFEKHAKFRKDCSFLKTVRLIFLFQLLTFESGLNLIFKLNFNLTITFHCFKHGNNFLCHLSLQLYLFVKFNNYPRELKIVNAKKKSLYFLTSYMRFLWIVKDQSW